MSTYLVRLHSGCGSHDDALLIETAKARVSESEATRLFGENFWPARDRVSVHKVTGRAQYPDLRVITL